MENYVCGNVEDHTRVIIHIDIDCFYAQVEMVLNPKLCNVPLGIQQKQIVVTSNYIAREFGIKKCMLVSEAKKLCPSLTLVSGEDLYNYRQYSNKVTTYLQQYSPLVEKLGLDENFIDVSKLVEDRLNREDGAKRIVGHVFGEIDDNCQCGCTRRLIYGSIIAEQIRKGIKDGCNLSTCAGVAHNKLLAKIVCATHKPNQQTTVLPNGVLELLLNLKNVRQLPGIGSVTFKSLEENGIKSIEDLQNCDFNKLKQLFGMDKAQNLVALSYGRDSSPVKATRKPLSIGLEDSCRSISAEIEIKDKFLQLLNRLMVLVYEDGRIPHTLKLTVRKHNNQTKLSHRDTKQCNISSNLFTFQKDGSVTLSPDSKVKLLNIIMSLFAKIVDVKKPYHITLLGLSFTKFQERVSGKNTIASYFVQDVSVQSLTILENKDSFPSTASRHEHKTQYESDVDSSETEVEPSPKKTKIFPLSRARSRLFDSKDCASPSKLKVAELRLNSREKDMELSPNKDDVVSCPPDASEEVFKELPVDVQKELWENWKRERESKSDQRPLKKFKNSTLLNYFQKQQ